MARSARYWVVTDLETTGTRVPEHEIIQVARVIFDVPARKVVPGSVYNAFVRPTRWEQRDPEALEVNKLEHDYLVRVGVSLEEALRGWARGVVWDQAVVAAWGIDFESKFLGMGYQEIGAPVPYPYSMVDLRTLAYVMSDLSAMLSLREAADFCNIGYSPADLHDARYDVALSCRDRGKVAVKLCAIVKNGAIIGVVVVPEGHSFGDRPGYYPSAGEAIGGNSS